jgi:transcriptional regulator with XRE-family HTH domain
MKQERLKLGLSQEKLAALVGTDKAHISRIESGARPSIAASTVARIATALGCSVDYLLGLTSHSRPYPRGDDLNGASVSVAPVTGDGGARAEGRSDMQYVAEVPPGASLKAGPDGVVYVMHPEHPPRRLRVHADGSVEAEPVTGEDWSTDDEAGWSKGRR